MVSSDRVRAVRAALEEAGIARGERRDLVLESGIEYLEGEPVQVAVSRRAHRYHLSDRGAALALAAGKPSAWLQIAKRIVARDGLNVNRRGVVFVQADEGRQLAELIVRTADASLAVFFALLEAQGRESPG